MPAFSELSLGGKKVKKVNLYNKCFIILKPGIWECKEIHTNRDILRRKNLTQVSLQEKNYELCRK